jgi:hypothetical protein
MTLSAGGRRAERDELAAALGTDGRPLGDLDPPAPVFGDLEFNADGSERPAAVAPPDAPTRSGAPSRQGGGVRGGRVAGQGGQRDDPGTGGPGEAGEAERR